MYNVLDICKFIIQYENSEGRQVSNLRLQKLIYFVQAQFIMDFNELCFEEEFEAWKFGPVLPTAYEEYKFYASSSISLSKEDEKEVIDIDIAHENSIQKTLNNSKVYTTTNLVDISHKKGGPWCKSYKLNKKEKILNECMFEYFVRG